MIKKVLFLILLVALLNSCALVKILSKHDVMFELEGNTTSFEFRYTDTNGDKVSLTHNDITLPYTVSYQDSDRYIVSGSVDVYDYNNMGTAILKLYVDGKLVDEDDTSSGDYITVYCAVKDQI